MRIKAINGTQIKESNMAEEILKEATIPATSRVTKMIHVVIQEATQEVIREEIQEVTHEVIQEAIHEEIQEETQGVIQEDIIKTKNTHHVTGVLNVNHKKKMILREEIQN